MKIVSAQTKRAPQLSRLSITEFTLFVHHGPPQGLTAGLALSRPIVGGGDRAEDSAATLHEVHYRTTAIDIHRLAAGGLLIKEEAAREFSNDEPQFQSFSLPSDAFGRGYHLKSKPGELCRA